MRTDTYEQMSLTDGQNNRAPEEERKEEQLIAQFAWTEPACDEALHTGI